MPIELGHAIAQTTRGWLLIVEPWVQSLVTSCEICGGHSSIVAGSSLCSLGFPLLSIIQPLFHRLGSALSYPQSLSLGFFSNWAHGSLQGMEVGFLYGSRTLVLYRTWLQNPSKQRFKQEVKQQEDADRSDWQRSECCVRQHAYYAPQCTVQRQVCYFVVTNHIPVCALKVKRVKSLNTVKPLSIVPGSVVQFLWSLSESYFNYGSHIYCFPGSIVSFSDPRRKRWIEVSLYNCSQEEETPLAFHHWVDQCSSACLGSYFWATRFKSQPGHLLFRLMFLVVSLSPSRRMPG
jgi:hypothetical protein